MSDHAHSSNRRGLALLEVLVTLVIVAAVGSLLLIAANDSRHRSRTGNSLDNLRFFAAGTQSYAADHANRFWTFSWTAGTQTTEYPDLNFAPTDLQAAANQAVYIMRRHGAMPQMPVITSWIPQIHYSYLSLFEHQGLGIPARIAVSPEDRTRLSWQRDAEGFLALPSRPGGTALLSLRWIFSSSYELGPAFWSPDAAVGQVSAVSQGSTHSTYFVPSNTPMGNRTIDQVRFPAHKAQLWDSHQRDLGRRVPYFAVQESRVPVLCVDGSAGVRSARYTNAGFQPNLPQSLSPATFTYQPDPAWEPPAMSFQQTDQVQGRQRYTRSGLRGRDYNGPEEPFSPP